MRRFDRLTPVASSQSLTAVRAARRHSQTPVTAEVTSRLIPPIANNGLAEFKLNHRPDLRDRASNSSLQQRPIKSNDQPEAASCQITIARETHELLSPMILCAGNPCTCRLLRILEVSLTVNIRKQNAEIFLPSGLPSKNVAWER